MPTPEEVQAQRNQQLARAVTSGELTDEQVARKWEPAEPELTDEQVAQVWAPQQQQAPGSELSDEEVKQRMTPSPEEVQNQFEGIVQRMAQNYQTSPQYAQLLEQELQQISEQIAQLTQRRNMIEMAKGQG